MYKLKNIAYYDNLKKTFNKHYSIITRKYINRKNIGTTSFLFYKYNPSSINDFFIKYINDPSPFFNKNNSTGHLFHGRNIKQLNDIAFNCWKEINNKNISQNMCLDIIINHTIIETYVGLKAELFIRNLIIKQNKFNVKNTYGFLDANCGVDLIINNKINDMPIFFLQIKPNTFFANTIYNTQLIEDKLALFDKQKNLNQFIKDNNIITKYNDTLFLIYNAYQLKYNNKLLWLNFNDNFKFNLKQLINDKAQTIIDINNINNYKQITI